jgi:hypothetical protein
MLILFPGDKVPANYKGDNRPEVVMDEGQYNRNMEEMERRLQEASGDLDRLIAEKKIRI